MARKKSALSSLIKAFSPPKARRRRRPPSAARSVSKAVQASTRAGTRVAKAAAPKPVPRRAASSRKPAAKPVPGKTARKVSKPSTARKPATPAPSAIGKGSWRQARFTGAAGTRAYRVYVPTGLGRTRKVPMLLALHGCGQNALDFAAGTRFNDLADKHKFVVVYPEQGVTHNGQRCWNWFRSGHQFRAQGEPAILAGIVRRVSQDTAKWRIDTERIYVAGISAGGAMAVVLAATYPELFAAIGVHSAPPYRSASGPVDALAAMQGRTMHTHVENVATAAMPPMIVFQGSADSTVRSVNAQRVADQWVAFHDHDAAAALGRPRSASTAPGRPGSARSRRGYRVSRWYSGGHKVLEVWVVTGLGHAWSGGSPKGSYSDSRGPRATTEMWKFFAANRSAAVNTEIRVS
ncbi:MAG: PHB depolymerase family esterase [Nakamurella sp.]